MYIYIQMYINISCIYDILSLILSLIKLICDIFTILYGIYVKTKYRIFQLNTFLMK